MTRKYTEDEMAMLAWRQLYETGRSIPEPEPAVLKKATTGVAIVRACENFPCADPADCACRGLAHAALSASIMEGP